MKRSSSVLAGAMAIVALINPALRADSGVQNVENAADSALNTLSDVLNAAIAGNPAKGSLTVKNRRPSGNYPPGTMVTVVADVPPGATFSGWTGDVAILSNPFLPTTTAMIPFSPVTIRASYTAAATDSAPATNAAPATNETPVANSAAPARKSVSARKSRWGDSVSSRRQ